MVECSTILTGCERTETRPSDLKIKLTADRQHGIPDRLTFKASGRKAPEKHRVGIRRQTIAAGLGRLLVGFRRNDEAVQRFSAPTACNELAGQPIEQLRMTGLGSASS